MSDDFVTSPGPASRSFERVAGQGLQDVLEVVAPVVERFRAAGHELYLVGGVVRDLALGSGGDLNDIDLTTAARPKEIKALLHNISNALWTQGERFGTIGAVVNGRDLEITTHRAESYDPDSRKPMVVFGDDLEIDLSRRDFTINAMAYSVVDNKLVDPFGGLSDLADRCLRTPDDPEVSFIDDPLRMLRAARFIPRFGLRVDPALELAVGRLGSRLAIVSAERIHGELEKLLAVSDPSLGFAFLEQTGLLARIIPGLGETESDLVVGSNGDTHPEYAGRSMVLAAATLGSLPASIVVRRAGLVAPIGISRVRAWLKALRYSAVDQRATLALLTGATLTLQMGASEPAKVNSTVRHLLSTVGFDHAQDALQLAANLATIDDVARCFGPGGSEQVAEVAAAYERLVLSEDLANLAPPISGGDLISELGLKPGPAVGQAIQMLSEHRLNVGAFGREEAFELARQWLAGE